MMKAQNKKLILGGAIAAGVLVVFLFIMLRSKKAAATPAGPEPEPEPEIPIQDEPPVSDPVLNPEPAIEYPVEPEPDPKPEPKPDPMKPVETAAKGTYYAVQKRDTMYGLLAAAGYPAGATRHKAYLTMLNHDRNAWIGEKNDSDGNRILRFNRHFAPNPGYESETWAWSTDYKSAASPNWKWPVVWIPSEGEVGA